MVPVIIFSVLFIFAAGAAYLSTRSAMNAKKNMLCLAFTSDEIFKETRLTLTSEKIFFTDMMWAPGQQGYNQLGTATSSPREIWIQKADSEKVKKLIEVKFKTESTPTGLIVS